MVEDLGRRYARLTHGQTLEPFFKSLVGLNRGATRRVLSRSTKDRLPALLCRYVPFNADAEDSVKRLRDVVVCSDLWLSSPNDFNDPFDFSANVVIEGTPTQVRDTVSKRFKAVAANRKELLRTSYVERWQKTEAIVRNPERHAEMVRASFRRQRDETGISCFTSDPRNIQMWSYYAASHTGLVLLFDTVRDPRVFGVTFPVDYRDEYPVFNWGQLTDDQFREIFTRKHSGWRHERERRFIEIGAASTYVPFDARSLIGIVFGERAQRKSIDAVLGLLEERRSFRKPPVRLYRANLHHSRYELRIVGFSDVLDIRSGA